MPELPEIETVTRQLVGQLRGRRFVDVSLCRRDFVHGDLRSLVGTAVSAVSRRGKLILVDCGPHHLLIHLGMSGRLAMADPSEPLPRHTHWRAYLDNDQELRHNDPRRFGGAWVVETACLHEHPKVVAIAPDPFQMSHREFHARLKHSRRAIKVWLMDQKQLGGVGNIYADEALFVAKIHPRKRTARLTPEQTACLLAALRTVLERAIEAGGSTISDYRRLDGQVGLFQNQHRVYDRERLPCPECATPIRRIVLGQRSSHFCPTCQTRK